MAVEAGKGKKKVVQVHVMKCFELKRTDATYRHKEMQPFFSFQFFTFDFQSPVLNGNNPFFDVKKQFEVELNEQFLEYMRTQVLKIDLIDESVDMTQVGQKDYIGSVRIPLREVMMQDEFADCFPVKDEQGNETGRMEVRVSCKDYQPYPYGDIPDQAFLTSKYAEQELLKVIAAQFAMAGIEDTDLIFDMLLENPVDQRVSKQRFKDYLL